MPPSIQAKDLAFLLLINIAMFGQAIQAEIGFSYCDEIVTLILIGFILSNNRKQRVFNVSIFNIEGAAICLLSAVVAIGVVSNLFNGVQIAVPAIIIDTFTCLKFPVTLIIATHILSNSSRLATLFEIEAKILISVMASLGIANLLFDFGMGSEPRLGLRASFAFIFNHPTYLVFCVAGLISFLMRDVDKNLSFIVMGMFVASLSLRSKAFAFVAVCVFLLIASRKHVGLKIRHVVIAGIVVCIAGIEQFATYYLSAGTARSELSLQSLAVAADFFPLGSGFATYGSAITAQAKYYSPLYYKYGLSAVWGLVPGSAYFMSDTFWPTVLAQFGWIGTALYIALLIVLFVMCYRTGQARVAIVCAFVYLLISSTSESAFFNPCAVYMALCIGLSMAPREMIRQ